MTARPQAAHPTVRPLVPALRSNDVLGGLEAALVFVVLVVPGYLAMGGYHLGRASPPIPGDSLPQRARSR
jgi:hypothetical protein